MPLPLVPVVIGVGGVIIRVGLRLLPRLLRRRLPPKPKLPPKPPAPRSATPKPAPKKKPKDKKDDCKECKGAAKCAAFANGSHGGSHKFMKGPVGDGLDSNHMPAASASSLPRDWGPAIRMSPKDHLRTASHGAQPGSAVYRAAQRRLIASGKFSAAFAMDVADIRKKFGSKYDVGIAQAGVYMSCLKRNGLIR